MRSTEATALAELLAWERDDRRWRLKKAIRDGHVIQVVDLGRP